MADAVLSQSLREYGVPETSPVDRDILYAYNNDGLGAGVGWGAYVGCLMMVALVAVLLMSVRRLQEST